MITDAELGHALTAYADALAATIAATEPESAALPFGRSDRQPNERHGSPRAGRVRGNGSRLALVAAIVVFALIAAAVVVIGRHDSPPAGAPGWTKLPDSPLGHREGAAVVWTGQEWLVFGGQNPAVDSSPYTGETPETAAAGPRGGAPPVPTTPPIDPNAYDGAAYDPASRTWSRIPRPDLGGRIVVPVAVSGSTLIVLASDDTVGGCASSVNEATTPTGPGGAIYDPDAKRWTILPTMPYRFDCAPEGAWMGSTLYVTGPMAGANKSGLAAYDRDTREWTKQAEPPVFGSTLVSSGGRLYAFGPAEVNDSITGPAISPARIASFDPATGAWTIVAAPPINAQLLIDVAGHPVAWDGARSAVLDPTNGTWRRLPDSPVARRDSAAVVAVGSRLVVWGGSQIADGFTGGPSEFSPITKLLDDGASYDFATNAWTTLPASPLSGRFAVGAAGSADSLFVWGGATTDRSDIPPADDGAILRLG